VTGTSLSAEDYAELFRSFQHTAFRMEDQQDPLAFERPAFEEFLAGCPLQPPDWPEWQGWLDRVKEMTARGKLVARVAIIEDSPTPYQRWRIWGAPWHRRAGEGIRILPRRQARALGIPAGNWWMFDDEHVVTVTFTLAGGVGRTTLITGPEVSSYLRWRDLAVSRAMMAETIAV
jgi:hypothetical protein